MTTAEARRTIHALFRLESPRLIAALSRLLRDVGEAEELAQDALVSALEHWPETGVPENPAAWLMATAKRRAIDELRRRKLLERKHRELGAGAELEQDLERELEQALDSDLGDDLLRLMFTACHPVLSRDARVALTLRLLGGLSTDEIARAFLAAEPTIAQRIVRAKRTLAEASVPFELPSKHELRARLGSVLEVIYLVFNEGYSATAGEDLMRPALCQDAIRLGRVLCSSLPEQAEAHGLLALMLIQSSRAAARTTAEGQPVLLLEQDRSLWDREQIREGLAALAHAVELAGHAGSYTLQAAIAACHARAQAAEDTDWPRIAALYLALSERAPSPIVELNRAVAVGMAFGPAHGLRILEVLEDDPTLEHYPLLPAVRGDLLAKLERHAEASAEFERAAELTRNAREREVLLQRAQASRRAKVDVSS